MRYSSGVTDTNFADTDYSGLQEFLLRRNVGLMTVTGVRLYLLALTHMAN